jgi:O-antigen/teichoic acid export membrane protein
VAKQATTADEPPAGAPAANRVPATDGAAAADAAAATRSGMRGLFGRDSIYLAVWALPVGVAALSIPINTRILGAGGYGVVTTALAVMQILVAIGTFSLPTAVQRAYRRDDQHDSRRIITLTICTAAVTLVVATVTGPYWASLLHLGAFRGALQYACIWAALTAVTYAALALLRSRDDLGAFSTVSFLQSVVAEVFSVLLVVTVHRTAREFVLGEMIAQAVAVALALYLTRPLPILRRHLAMVGDALRYSGALVPAAIGGFMLVVVDRLVIRADLPIAQVARYGAIYNLAAIPALLLGVLDTVWMPRFFDLSDRGTRRALLAESRDATSALLIPLILALSFAMPLVLAVWVPPSYHPHGLWLETVTIAASGFPVAGFFAERRVLLISGTTWPVGAATVAAALFNLALNIALVPVIGIEGSALATLLSYVVLHLVVLAFARRDEPLRRQPLRLTLACWGAVALAAASTLLPASGGFAALRVVATAVCAFAFASMLMRIVVPGFEPRWLRPVGWGRRA